MALALGCCADSVSFDALRGEDFVSLLAFEAVHSRLALSGPRLAVDGLSGVYDVRAHSEVLDVILAHL